MMKMALFVILAGRPHLPVKSVGMIKVNVNTDKEERQRAKERLVKERLMKEDMSEAHAEGLHDDLSRDFCPDCEVARPFRGRVEPDDVDG
jgi:hypothetical protein